MNVIKIKIDFEKGLCQKEGISVVTGDYNSTKIEFEFNESAADGRKIFELKNSDDELVYVDEIVNNEVILVGKREEEGEEKLFSLFNKEGDYTFEVSLYGENSKLTSVYDYITARKEQVIVDDETVEQYMPLFDNLMQELSNKVAEADSKIDEIDQAIEEANQAVEDAEEAVESTNNLNIDVNKVDKTTQVDLTKKDGTTKTVYINDGTSLQFMWQGTSLGIKTDDMEEYVFVNLQGIQGQPGPQGEPFRIKKTYTSVAEMNADFDNMNVGDYVMIASTVEIEDNAKLYVKGDSQWIFITDFSGAQGIKGETGATPIIRIGTVVSGSTPSVTISGTAEEPVFNFVLQPGEKGEKGDTGSKGDTGNGIASIVKTASAGLIDTYTITFTNGSTTTFNITNGQDGDVTQEYVDEENERLKSVFNVLPKVSGSGESVTLNNTGDTMLYKVDLKGNTSQEVIQGEVGLEEEDTSIYVDDVNEDKENYINLKGNTYQDSTSGKNLLPNNITSQTINGITITKNNDGSLLINGTSNATTILIFGEKTLQAGTYTISTHKAGTADNTCYISSVDTSTGSEIKGSSFRIDNSNSKTYTLSETTTISYRFYTGGSRTFTNFKIYPMLEQGSSATDYEPYTNGASPNPDYSQEIEVVTGLNEVIVEGKNLLDTKVFENRMINCYVVNSNGTITQTATDTNFWQTSYMPNSIVLNKGTYTISVTNRNGRLQVYNLTTNSNIVEASVDSYTFTLNDDNQVINVKLYGASASSYPFTFTMQIEKGNTATTYEAYKGQTYEIDLRTSKNIFDITKILKNKDLKKDTGQVRDTTGWYVSDWIAIKPNTAYTSSNISSNTKCWYDKNKTFISYVNATTATSPANAKYLRVNGTLASIENNPNLMIEEGDSQTTYEPYTSIELCKIGNYKDRIYKDSGKWYIEKQIRKFTFGAITTGTFDTSGTYKFFKWGTREPDGVHAGLNVYCNYLIGAYNLNDMKSKAQYNNSIYWGSSSGFIRVDDFETTEEYIDFINNHEIEVYARLRTPTDTQITDTTLVNQLNALYNATIYPITHINTETSNLLPYIDLKYNVVTPAPSPERASEVKVVTGENVVTICGKNVFNIAKLENSGWNYPNTNTRVSMFLDKVAQGTKMSVTNRDTTTYRYAVGFAKLGYASRDNIIVNESGWQTASTYTITASGEGYPFLQISRIDNGNISASEVEGKFQYEYGDTPTTYEPYQSQSYPVNLGNLELCKIGDYQDYLYKDSGKWYKYSAIGKVVLGGSENWQQSGAYTNNTIYSVYSGVVTNYNYGQAISDLFIWNNNILPSTITEYIATGGDTLRIGVLKSRLSAYTINEFKTWLSNNNVTTYYVLATPTTTEITNSTLIAQLNELKKAMSYYDKTLITQTNASKPFILDVIAIRDLQDIFNL